MERLGCSKIEILETVQEAISRVSHNKVPILAELFMVQGQIYKGQQLYKDAKSSFQKSQEIYQSTGDAL